MSERTLVVAVEPRSDADCIASALRERMGIDGDDIRVLIPEDALGSGGFWSGDGGERWWDEQLLDAREVVLVAQHRRGLPHVLWNVASRWLVWCATDEAAAAYAGHPSASALRAADATACGARVAEALTGQGWHLGHRPSWGPFRPMSSDAANDAEPAPPATDDAPIAAPEATSDTLETIGTRAREDAQLLTAASWSDPPPPPQMEWPVGAHGGDGAQVELAVIPEPSGAALLQRSPGNGALGAPPRQMAFEAHPEHPPRGIGQRFRSLWGRTDGPRVESGALGQSLTRWHDTLVLVGSRKGGVGKTTESLALGFLAAQAVEALGGSAVVIDANLTNADLAVKLNLSPQAATVRDVVGALMRQAMPPTPASVRGSSLRVLGEHRATERYEPLEIDLLAAHLRALYTLSVVDLPNAVPGLEEKAEAVVEAWLPHADVVVVPIDTSIASLEGAADMLAAVGERSGRPPNGHRPGVVVAFLRPSDLDPRRIAPELDTTLRELEELGAAVVEIPASSRLAMVDWSNHPTPLVGVDPRVTRAYWDLLAAVADVRPGAGP